MSSQRRGAALPKRKKEKIDGHLPLGRHIIADFFGSENLNDQAYIKKTLFEAAKAAKATVLGSKFHRFSPQGVTGYLLLAESHISIHTWPEHGYAAVDVFTCGDMDPHPAFLLMKKKFKSSSVKTVEIMRGF